MISSKHILTVLASALIAVLARVANDQILGEGRSQLEARSSNYCFKTLTTLPHVDRVNYGLAAIGPDIYFIGGRTVHRAVVQDEREEDYTTSVDIYHTLTNTWSKAPDFPIGLKDPNVIAHNGSIYLLGGNLGAAFPGTWAEMFARNQKGELAAMYTPGRAGEDGVWKTIAPSPRTRGGSILGVADDGSIWVVGGNTGIVRGCAPCGSLSALQAESSIWIYDPRGDTWTEQEQRTFGGPGVIVGNKLYIQDTASNCEYLLFDLDSLTAASMNSTAGVRCMMEAPFSPLPEGWERHTYYDNVDNKGCVMRGEQVGYELVSKGTEVYRIGGWTISSRGYPTSRMRKYDTVRDYWFEIEPGLRLPRSGIRAIAVGDTMNLFGGAEFAWAAEPNFYDIVESYGLC